MKTRRAKEDSPFRQERYMSSPELQRGLLATCVASRCRALDDEEDRNLVWFLQRLSHQPGGIEKAVEEMVRLWPERLSTPEMIRFGANMLRRYSRDEVGTILTSISKNPCVAVPLDSDRARYFGKLLIESGIRSHLAGIVDPESASQEEIKRRESTFSYRLSTSAFRQLCRDAAFGKISNVVGLADFLFKRVCLDPTLQPSKWRTWYFPKLRESLVEYKAHCLSRAASNLAMTEIAQKVFDALDYSLDIRGLVLIQGLERRGKTMAAKAWCDLHPGKARYVKVPSTSDDIGFFREIARSLGIGCGQAIKTVELRDRIEETLLDGDLMLVFDNAHFLFRQAMYREAIPQRLTWVLTALVDEDIPVALVSTPQFTVAQQLTSEKSKWREAQLTGRIAHFEQLPQTLSVSDLQAVARTWLPDADTTSLELLVNYAEASDKYLQAIGALTQRAIYLAKKEGRSSPTAKDIKEALRAGVIPSDSAIAEATQLAMDHVRGRRGSKRSTAAALRASRIYAEAELDLGASTDSALQDSDIRDTKPTPLIPDRNFTRPSGANSKAVSMT
jgi:hypothetical protein